MWLQKRIQLQELKWSKQTESRTKGLAKKSKQPVDFPAQQLKFPQSLLPSKLQRELE